MAVIYLRLSKRHNELGRNEIILTFRQGSTIYQRSGTEIFILNKPIYWDGEKMVLRARMMTDEVRYHREMKVKLENLCSAITKEWEQTDRKNISPTWLKDVIDRFNHPEKFEADAEQVIRKTNVTSIFIEYMKKHKVSENREKHMWSLWRVFRRFEVWRNVTFEFETFSHEDLDDFRSFLISEHEYWSRDEKTNRLKCSNRRYNKAYTQVNDECLKLGLKLEKRCPEPRSKNTLNNILVRLKTFWTWCIKHGYTERNPFNKFTIESAEYGTPYYITIDERHQLEEAELDGMVAVQRDIFVFQCCVGCRVGDLYKLTYANIVDGILTYTPRKTKDNNPVLAEVPLNATARALLEKYYDPNRDALFPFISQQRYNDNIRKAFKQAGLNRKVAVLNPLTRQHEIKPLYEVASSHMARRAFVGGLYHKVQDPNAIGSMTGHAEGSKAFARYRKVELELKKSLTDMLD